jgi:hypothetical protein
MIPFRIGDKRIELPTAWDEVTLQQAIKLSCIPESPDYDHNIYILSALTGLTLDECSRIAVSDYVTYLLPMLQFVNEQFDENNLMNQPLPDKVFLGLRQFDKYYPPGQMIWAQHLTFESIASNKKLNDLQKIPDIIATCIQKPDEYSEEVSEELKPFILKLSLFEAMAISGWYLKAITAFYKTAKLKNDEDYTNEQIRAGIKEFSKFGAFNSIDALAGGDITKWEAVVRLPMSDVVLKLKMNQQQYRYEKKYHEIMLKKK